jgi:cleavage and polyadenylation specificity factor subunit 1
MDGRIHIIPGTVTSIVDVSISKWFLQRDLPARTKRKLHIIGGARGMWSLPVRQPVKVNGVSYERPVNPYQLENDSLIVSTDASPSPGLSRVCV